ncbi:MAG: EcsC family protein [Lachnospiraceae bacterium]
MKLPIVKVNRQKFLYKELIKYYSEDVVDLAIKKNAAYAGMEKEKINEVSKQVINYETNKVSAISFAAGMPGGFAMVATVPADIAQYFAYMIRVMQKLAYLYGFEDFELNEDAISDNTMNQIMIFLGVMFGVQGANAGVKKIAEVAAKKVSKSLAQKALTKGTVYPIVKKIAQAVGIKMTKQIFAESVSKVVPVIGGAVTGGLSYITFKPCAKKLKNSFKDLYLCDPQYYEELRKQSILDIDTVIFDEVENKE